MLLWLREKTQQCNNQKFSQYSSYNIGVNFAASSNGFRYASFDDFVTTLLLVGIGGTLAFAMEVAEFAIVQIASSLTLSIIGVTKVRIQKEQKSLFD